MDIERMRAIVKSNLVSFNLSAEDIASIVEHIVTDLLEEYRWCGDILE
jgi:hypothetical protein